MRSNHPVAVALHVATVMNPDYLEARLTRLHLQAKVKRLSVELETAVAQFQEAIEREDAMQRGHED